MDSVDAPYRKQSRELLWMETTITSSYETASITEILVSYLPWEGSAGAVLFLIL